MPHKTQKRLISACCSMELCWLCAWANFLTVSTTKTTFPFGILCIAFLMALSISFYFKTKEYRLIYQLLAHVLGVGILIIIAISTNIGFNFSITAPVTVFEWYQIILITTLVCLFWYKGIKISTRQMSYKSTCNHFDLGISLLFVLLAIKLLIQYKTGIQLSESFTLYNIILYFLFGLTAIFLSNNTTSSEKEYLKGFQVYSVLISALMTLLFCSLASFFILLPFMKSFAESGYTVLKQTTAYFSPYLISILQFILSRPRNSMNNIAVQQNKTIVDIDTIQGTVQTSLDSFIHYTILIISITISIFFIGSFIYIIFKLLMKKHTPTTLAAKEKTLLFSRLFYWLIFLFNNFKKAILNFFEKLEDGKKGFEKLVLWGKRSGIPKLHNETPAEYGIRLRQQFAPLENEILIIIHAFQLETYGKIQLDPTKISKIAKAVKKINSPSFWSLRIKSFCNLTR